MKCVDVSHFDWSVKVSDTSDRSTGLQGGLLLRDFKNRAGATGGAAGHERTIQRR